jgi:putative serine protease PepD
MNRRPGRIPIVVMTLLATLAVGVGAGAVAYSTFSDDTKTVIQPVRVGDSEPTASSSTLTAAQIYRNTNRSVVEITVGSVQVDPFGGEQQQRGQGSGFVYDSEGHIVTNDHVVESAETVSVRFWNGNTYDANVVGTDPSTDLAVIKVDAPDSVLHPLTVGDSSDVQVGNTVFALGSPFGLEDSFTSGIVSALHRQIEAPNDFTINDSIQTDAAINHGNSGGPLLNSSGEVIGVNAQIAGNTGANVGIGFAIPSNTVKKIAAQLIDTGEVEHAYLGVQVQDVPASVADELNLVEGVQIASFPEIGSRTPAQRAGLRAATGERTIDGEIYPTGGDVVTEIDGQKITSTEALQRAIDAKQPGDTITVTYWRNGDSHTVDVKLASRPEEGAPDE